MCGTCNFGKNSIILSHSLLKQTDFYFSRRNASLRPILDMQNVTSGTTGISVYFVKGTNCSGNHAIVDLVHVNQSLCQPVRAATCSSLEFSGYILISDHMDRQTYSTLDLDLDLLKSQLHVCNVEYLTAVVRRGTCHVM